MKKRGIVIAVMLLLFLGTGTFVFANPSEDEITGTGNKNTSDTVKSGKDYTNDYEDDNIDDQEILNDSDIAEDLNSNDLENNGLNQGEQNRNNSRNNNTNSNSYNSANNLGNNNSTSTNNGNNSVNNDNNGNINDNSKPDNSGNGNGSNSNNDNIIIDKTYELALEALIKAENSLNQEDINNAKNLINNVTDLNKKNELLNRLNNLQNKVNIINMVNNLQNMVSNAHSKNDINNAINYRKDEKIIDKVNNLENNQIKTDLLNKLSGISKVIDDHKSPIISGINNGDYTNTKVFLNITDDNSFTIYLNGLQIDKLESLETDGNYSLKVVDKAFNETNISFVIDTTAPIISNLQNNDYYNNAVDIDVFDNNDVIITLKKDGKDIPFDGNPIKEEGKYLIYAIDKAGNKSDEITFTIDLTNPKADIIYSIRNITNNDVVAKIVNASEEIKIINNNESNEYTFKENGEFTFIIEDLAGNRSFINAKVDWIDKVAPLYKKFGILNQTNLDKNDDPTKATENDEILVFVSFDKQLKVAPVIEINGKVLNSTFDNVNSTKDEYRYITKYVINKDEMIEGNVQLVVKDYQDLAGNTGSILTNDQLNDEIYNSLNIYYNNGFEFIPDASFNTNHITVSDLNYAYMTVYNWQTKKTETVTGNTYTVTDNTMYTFVLYDKDNKVIKRVMMVYDNIKPKIIGEGLNGNDKETIVENGVYDSVDLTITDNDLHIIKRVFDNGNEEIIKTFDKYDSNRDRYTQTFKDSGHYKIVAVDRAGNEKSISFAIKENHGVFNNIFSVVGLYN